MTPRCKICSCPDTHASPGVSSWAHPNLCDVCADVLLQPEVLDAAREVAFRMKDHGPSATKDLTRFAHGIAGAVLRVCASKPKKRKSRAHPQESEQ